MILSNPFKAHCSAIGAIMSEPQTKSPLQKYTEKQEQIKKGELDLKALEDTNKTGLKTYPVLQQKVGVWKSELPELERNKDNIHLSKTCIAHIYKWIKEQPEFYNKRKDFKSKYTDKGNLCEQDSIEFAAKYYGWGLVEKNQETMENEYIIGTADVVLAKSIEDIKNSWSQDTFPLFDTEIPIDGYGWQLQGYMELWDKPQAGLVYTLMDAPDIIVERIARGKMYDSGLTDLEEDLYEEVKSEMMYSQFRDELRIKRFFLDRDKSMIEAVYERVELCRKFIDRL